VGVSRLDLESAERLAEQLFRLVRLVEREKEQAMPNKRPLRPLSILPALPLSRTVVVRKCFQCMARCCCCWPIMTARRGGTAERPGTFAPGRTIGRAPRLRR
jgi:hypothetical protein